MTRKRHGSGKGRVATRFVKIAEPITEGRVRCVCGKAVKLTPSGHITGHKMPNGDDCLHHASYNRVHLTEIPPVVIPRQSIPPRQTPSVRAPGQPSRLDVGSHCGECGKWLPGERRLCGRCTAIGGRA